MKENKPLLTTDEQINHLKENGITFNLTSEEKAKHYLRYNINYFKLTSYRKNFDKYQAGKNIGKYLDLDFGYLTDLAVIDIELRYVFVQLALDIEHHIKMQLMRITEDHQEDGYTICKDFENSLDENQRERLKSEINRNEKNVYCGNLVEKYRDHFPIWAFLELIPFGRLVYFYGFCAKRFNSPEMRDRFYALKTCNQIRNAAAHSSCIINELRPYTADHEPRNIVRQSLSQVPGISKGMRKKKLSNARIQQIVTLLYIHTQCVTSRHVHRRSAMLLNALSHRMMENIDYYQNNDLITSSFQFLTKIIDFWFPTV